MPVEDCSRYFEILEIPPGSSLLEVRSAYQHLKELYSTDSIATHPVKEEFSEESRREILSRIEHAYSKLAEMLHVAAEVPQPALDDDLREFVEGIPSFGGEALRRVREKLGFTLAEVSSDTKIHRQYLEDIEIEKFGSLPPEVYIRGYIVVYARHLRLDPERVAADFIKRYRIWKGA
jgi:hypothetical protein